MISRVLCSTLLMLFVVCISGCGDGAPSEASGDPVPADYEAQQAEAQKAAQEAAMKNAKRGR